MPLTTPWCVRMPHAKYGQDQLKTVAIDKEQRDRHTDSVLVLTWCHTCNKELASLTLFISLISELQQATRQPTDMPLLVFYTTWCQTQIS